MAITKTSDLKTIKQSWHEAVSTLDREETPFLSSIGTTSTTNILREFFSKKLNDAAANAQAEGADAPTATSTLATRAANVCQIFAKTRSVSTTVEDSSTVSNVDHMAEQIKDASKEIKRDIEKAITGPQGSVLSGTRELAGAEAWIKTNASHGTDGVTGGYNPTTNVVADVVDGTLREFTETMLNDAFQDIWEQGGRAKTIMLGGTLKRKLSTFNGGTTVNTAADKKTIVNAVDYYEGDFGKYIVKPNFIMRTRTVLLLDETTWAASYLTKFTKKDLPAGGLYEAKMIHAELTLEARDETGNGKIADVQAAAV
ncbi:Putative phage major head protein [Neorhizobium galegae bv. officinalis]|nr:Putative phage major head protein [Neorhizobium galegae bv. officinalis]